MKRCFIFAAGTFYGLRERPAPGDLVIAADAGYQTCRKLGIEPDLVLGDFDSMPVPEHAEEIIRLPVEKDDTDTIAAVRKQQNLTKLLTKSKNYLLKNKSRR